MPRMSLPRSQQASPDVGASNQAGERLWVLVADESMARLLTRPRAGADLEEIETLTDAGARADAADLRRDAYGRRAGSGTLVAGNATSSASQDELQREAANFAARVAERLAQAQQQGRFDRLIIAAAPRFLGLLRKSLAPAVAQRVSYESDHDLIHLSPRELTLRLASVGS